MSTPESTAPAKARKINLRTPDVMARVQEQVESHYRSTVVERIRANGGVLQVGGTTVLLAKQFGFCYGVERGIRLAWAAAKSLQGKNREAEIEDLAAEDVVIVPAFGTDLDTLQKIHERGCQIVDTTCGDVMSVWKRVRQNASENVTSIIHGKAEHEETKATASRALGHGHGHYLIVLTLKDTDYVCNYIRYGGNKQEFLSRFEDACSPGFDPDIHLKAVGVANQTTMLRGEPEEVQRRVRAAIIDRDGPELGAKNFRFFDTICGATQERQDALRVLLKEKMDLLLVGGA